MANTLMLPNPGALYRFANVGAIIKIAQADSLELIVIIGGKRVPIKISRGGNWVLVHVGAMPGMETPGVDTVDNPFAPTSEKETEATHDAL